MTKPVDILEPGPDSAEAPRRTANAAFDEAFDAEGRARPHWQALFAALQRMGGDELATRADNGRRLLREHGVTFSASGSHDAPVRPWELDFLPLVLSAADWEELKAGLIQRARLLDLVLADLYGKQRLVRNGFVPAPLIYANPGYLRACQGLTRPGATYLHAYAADLARGPDGKWRVLADHTQSPAGLGFTLECRTVTTRVLPEVAQEVQPRHLADALEAHRQTLRELAPQARDNPTIVLLTPGPHSEVYFEHAYIARRQGFTLLEGEDLTVRGQRLFIKTVAGLRPVDVVLRRIHDGLCDPLELRGDSLLGVPGLVQAIRAGHVAMANALGSGLVESPALLPFLPGVCRHLLGEDLRLPSIATWWCGQRHDYYHVRNHLDALVVRRAFGPDTRPLQSVPDDLATQMLTRPYEWLAQEPVRPALAPLAKPDEWPRRPFVLRLFLVHDGQSHRVVPGGLAFVTPHSELATPAVSLGALCKDVWVEPAEAQPEESHVAPAAILSPNLERTALSLPSRTADNFFWLGRYAERLEHLARIARCVVGRLSDHAGRASEPTFAALLPWLASIGALNPAPSPRAARDILQREILLVLYQRERPAGVRDLLRRLQATAFTVRYRLSADTWRVLNRLAPETHERSGHLPLVQAATLLNGLVRDLAAFSGMEMENMTRGDGWTFLDLGRRLERGLALVTLLGGLVSRGADHELLLEPALEMADSTMTYRQRHFTAPQLEGVLELLLTDTSNPRSLAFQLARIREHATHLPADLDAEGVEELRRSATALVEVLPPPRTLNATPEPRASHATTFPWSCADRLSRLSDILSQVYFSHVRPRVN